MKTLPRRAASPMLVVLLTLGAFAPGCDKPKEKQAETTSSSSTRTAPSSDDPGAVLVAKLLAEAKPDTSGELLLRDGRFIQGEWKTGSEALKAPKGEGPVWGQVCHAPDDRKSSVVTLRYSKKGSIPGPKGPLKDVARVIESGESEGDPEVVYKFISPSVRYTTAGLACITDANMDALRRDQKDWFKGESVPGIEGLVVPTGGKHSSAKDGNTEYQLYAFKKGEAVYEALVREFKAHLEVAKWKVEDGGRPGEYTATKGSVTAYVDFVGPGLHKEYGPQPANDQELVIRVSRG